VTVTVAGAGAHLEVLALPGASSAIGMADGEGGATVTVPGRSGAVVRRGG
jgi:hypothetical protein